MLQKSILAIALILMGVCIINAQVPQLINYQGVLSDAAGNKINGSRSIQFSIYNSATGGTALWYETQPVVVTDGWFNVLLGSVTAVPYTVFNGSDKFLSLKVGTDPEMTPRKRLVSVGYSFRAYDADKVDGKDASTFIEKVNSVTPLNGNIDLVGGTNMTITPDITNHKITISGGGGDNLGNHTATQNIKQNGNWLSGDGGNEGVFVDNSGNIGIGTKTPLTKLEIQSTSPGPWEKGVRLLDPNMQVNNKLLYVVGKTDNNKNAGQFYFHYAGDASVNNRISLGMCGVDDVINVMGSGNVGIGTQQPGAKLQVNGGIRARGGVPGGYGVNNNGYAFTGNNGDEDSGIFSSADGQLEFYTNSAERIRINSSGNVGIGTNNPQAALHVFRPNMPQLRLNGGGTDGFVDFYKGGGGFLISINGKPTINITDDGNLSCSVLKITGGSDIAEPFDINEKDAINAGMVVTIDPQNPGKLKIADKPYDRCVVGIISGAGDIAPGMIMGQTGTIANGEYPVALSGRVYCWADASNGSIQPGDLLTTSETPGHAMKVADFSRAQGAILGKAMSSLEEGQGLVLVLVTLQ